MGEAEAFRFREPNCKTVVEGEDLGGKAAPTSTNYKNQWAVTNFNEWQTVQKTRVPVMDSRGMFQVYDLHKVGVLSTQIKDMDELSLNYWRSKCEKEWTKVSSKDCVWHCMQNSMLS